MKLRSLVILLLLAVLVVAGCGKAKDQVANENEVRPGRDKELYEEALKKLRKGRYDEARLLFHVVITTYADSEYLPLAKLAIADSFYLEGGSSNLEQAIGGYKDFAQYFPTHPLTCHVKLKIAEAYMRQIPAYNRDWTKAKQAEHNLLATLSSCQNSPLKPQIEERLRQVQQVLGLHEQTIGDYYFERRQAYKAAEGRYRDVVTKYPYFTYRDKALYRLSLALIEQEQPEEAAQYLTELARDYPNSEYAKDARDYLEKLGKPVPTPSNDNPPPERPGLLGKFALIIGRNELTISKDGVLVSKKGEVEEDIAKAQEGLENPTNATGGTGQSIRVSSTGGAITSAPVNGSSNKTATENNNPVKAQPASSSETKKEDNKKQQKKKGLLGRIFR
jgi:outer membrane protein assembly factor BamD